MLVAPDVRKPSRLPTILMAVAVASAVSYFAFFRHKAEAPAVPPAAAATAVAAAPKVEPPAPAAPDPLPAATPESKPRAAAVAAPAPVPVAFTPAVRSPKTEVEELIADGKWRDARARISAVFGGAIGDAERLELAQLGMRINQELLQNRADERDVELYEIQQGDTLESIAKKFKALNGVKGSIMYVNNYKENAILRVGRKVRVTKGSWSLLLDKSLFKMWVLYEGCPFKGYTITTGAPNKETPVTKFVVGGKNPHPAWWPPSEMKVSGKIPVPYGDPQNPLGEWWVSLEHDLFHGIGIHGTNDPGSIGSKASNGCIRMLNEEVVEVAALAFKGMVVSIVE